MRNRLRDIEPSAFCQTVDDCTSKGDRISAASACVGVKICRHGAGPLSEGHSYKFKYTMGSFHFAYSDVSFM